MLKVELTGRRYAELTLPATPYAVLDALEKLELEEVGAPGWDVIDFCGNKSILKYLDKDGTLFELNALCQQLALLDEGQLAIVEGLAKIEYDKNALPIPLSRLIDMAYSTDRCHHVEEATDDCTLGRFCAENGFVPEADDLSDEAFELLDFARIGREFRQNEGGVFTSGGYVQRHDELRQIYKTLDFTAKMPDYTVLAETSSGCEVRLPVPSNEPMGTEPVRCVDCAAPALIGISGGMESMDLLARRLFGMAEMDTLPKYKAVLEATGCDEICWALAIADELEQYSFDPKVRDPEEVAEDRLFRLLPPEEVDLLTPSLNLYQYGQTLIGVSGQLTGYGFVERVDGQPVQAMTQGQSQTGGMNLERF